MIKIDHTEVVGWEAAIRGMRNPLESWGRHDSCWECTINDDNSADEHYHLGPNDHSLMMRLRNAGTDHRKYLRMIAVYADITAPLYWWKEYDTYKVGTVADSCSTMHKIHAKEFTLDDFSHEHLTDIYEILLEKIVVQLNGAREEFVESTDKHDWWQMIQLLPSSYNQKRTVMLNYEVLANQYHSRLHHKLDEWQGYCQWIESLPCSELITGERHDPDCR